MLKIHAYFFLILHALCVFREWYYPGACLPEPISHGYLLHYPQSLYWTQAGFGHAPVWDSMSWEVRPAARTWCVADAFAWTRSQAWMTAQKSSYAAPFSLTRSSWLGPDGQTVVKKGAQHSPRWGTARHSKTRVRPGYRDTRYPSIGRIQVHIRMNENLASPGIDFGISWMVCPLYKSGWG